MAGQDIKKDFLVWNSVGGFMNNEKRKEFWDTLLSLEGNNKSEDMLKLQRKIDLPRYLYRYRSISTNNLDALRTNRLFFSKANYYDDPFDTFINVNLRDLEKAITEISSNQDGQTFSVIKKFFSIYGIKLTDTSIAEPVEKLKKQLSEPVFIDSIKDYIRNIRNEMRKDIWSVCFSENGFNEVLWLKYAQQHQGFVVQYDLLKPDKLLCGTQEKCNKCGVSIAGTPLYPIYYSNEQYNGTRLAQFIVICKIMGLTPDNKYYELLRKTMGGLNWERERISLIKKECHKYDEEWRIILNCNMQPPVMREWIPEAVILGLNIKPSARNLVITTAKEAGIERIYDSYINDDGKLDARPI